MTVRVSARTHHPQMPLLVLVPVRDDDLRALLCELVDEVSPQEAGASKDSRDVARLSVAASC